MALFHKPGSPMGSLDQVHRIISQLSHALHLENRRIRQAYIAAIFFTVLFVIGVGFETTMAAMMFSFLQIEVLGHIVTGAAFALLVPIAITAAHIRLHHDHDWFLKLWLSKLSSIGILLFAIGISLMVGFSAWQAAQDATAFLGVGPVGSIGGQNIGSGAGEPSLLSGLLATIPNVLLFLGLSFGMIITIYVASFCLGKVIEALRLIKDGPRASKEIKAKIKETRAIIKTMRGKILDLGLAQRRLPFDPKHKFAREAAHACWEMVQIKLAASRRAFALKKSGNPLSGAYLDHHVDSIPAHFKTEEQFARHMADQLDGLRIHHLLRVLTGVRTTKSDLDTNNDTGGSS